MTVAELLVIARWVHFVAAAILFGTPLFSLYARPNRAATSTFEETAIRPAAIAALLSGLAWLGLSIVDMTGDAGSLLDADLLQSFFFQTGFGPVWLIRLALFAAAIAIALWSGGGLGRSVLLFACGGLLLITQAWLGHATDEQGWLKVAAITAYGIHVLGAGAWIGGLLPLGFELGRLQKAGGDAAARSAKMLVRRFSWIGTVAVAAILLSGVINTSLRIGSWRDLAMTDYGRILTLKLGLLAVMLALAGVNRFALTPRISALSGAIHSIRQNALLELLLGILILGAAAALGSEPPPG